MFVEGMKAQQRWLSYGSCLLGPLCPPGESCWWSDCPWSRLPGPGSSLPGHQAITRTPPGILGNWGLQGFPRVLPAMRDGARFSDADSFLGWPGSFISWCLGNEESWFQDRRWKNPEHPAPKEGMAQFSVLAESPMVRWQGQSLSSARHWLGIL